MSYDSKLDAKIHRFLARKEREHPELHESVDQLFYELMNPHMSDQLHEYKLDKLDRQDNRFLGGRSSGLHYAL